PTAQSKSASIAIANSTPLLTISCSGGPSSVAAGASYATTCSAAGGTAGYTWSFALPSWLTASGTTGPSIMLTGTMPSPPPTSYTVTATVTDSGLPTSQSQSTTFTIGNSTSVLQISCSPTTGTVNAGASFSTTCNASGA